MPATPPPAPASSRAPVYLVPHTHWDREWYQPFQRFRMGLVDLVDTVLAMAESDPRFCFTFDGQTAAVDDYLEIRPDAEPRLRALVEAGRLAIGPFRILADELLASGESLIRNLEAGLGRAAELGGAMAAGYLPDQFGHAAQMPQILRRAGLDRAVVWRGVPASIGHHAFTWASPDGSTVRAEQMVGGYGNAAHLFDPGGDRAARLERLVSELGPWFGPGEPLLAMYGTDHSAPLAGLAQAASDLGRDGEGHEVVVATLEGYLRAGDETRAGGGNGASGQAAGGHDAAISRSPDGDQTDPALPRWEGELRSGARANLLVGVTSTRIGLKAACTRAERLLERYAEPLSALHGGEWPAAFLDLAWSRVVEASNHDSVTGCGIDTVAGEVATRLDQASQLAGGVVDRVLTGLAARVQRPGLIVVNPSPTARWGLVEVDLAVPGDWAEVALVGPGGRRFPTQARDGGAGGGGAGGGRELVHAETMDGADLGRLWRRTHGRELFGRIVNGWAVEPGSRLCRIILGDQPDPVEVDMDRLRSELERAGAAAPGPWRVELTAPPRRRLATMVEVPALGWSAFGIAPGSGDLEAMDPAAPAAAATAPAAAAPPAAAAAHPARHATISLPDAENRRIPRAGGNPAATIPAGWSPVSVSDSGRAMTNGLVSVSVEEAGTLAVTGAGAQVSVGGLGRLVDGGDAGDTYNYAPPARDLLVTDPEEGAVAVEATASGPVVGELTVVRTCRWPEGLDAGGTARSPATRSVAVTMRASLRAGEPFVRLALAFDNPCSDHRVRLHLPLPRPASTTSAEGQLAVVERSGPVEGGGGEVRLATHPARGWVDAGGLAVLLDHTSEYELVPGEGGGGGGEHGGRGGSQGGVAPTGDELALTVVRSTGWISRNTNAYRDEPAGPEMATPGAQCLGPVFASLALYPHAGSWFDAGVVEAAEAYHHQLLAAQATAPPATGPPATGPTAGAELAPP
ncbi:MAG: hypothetical protein ACRD0J_10880, partial [Acidimicrobiales bacterium]